MAVAQHLNLDVARLLDKLLDEDAVIAKAVAGFVLAAGKAFKSLFVVEGHAQALATAAGRRLNHHGVTDALGNLHRLLRAANRLVVAGDGVDPGLERELLGGNFVAHGGNRMRLGADEGNALVFATLGKRFVLAQKAVARVHGLCAGLFAGGDDFLCLQIALAAGRRADIDGLICQRHVAGFFVGVRIHGNRLDAHFFGGSNDAAGDFATVGDQDFGEHVCLLTMLGLPALASCLVAQSDV